MKVCITFSCQTQLIYVLNDTKTAALWHAMLGKMSLERMHRTKVNHRHGFANRPEIEAALYRLRLCANFLGFPFNPINSSNWQSELNRLHINFPSFFESRFDRKKFDVAHETNLLIHWLEYELANVFKGKAQYIFNLDFNHDPAAYNLKARIDEKEFANFSPVLKFGNLHLHYIYIGRHFLEMYDAHDLVCPSEHFKAQHEFNATCGLSFSEPGDQAELNQSMNAYFVERGGKSFFAYDYGDPALAKGFFTLGQLQDMHKYSSRAQRDALRDKLKSSEVVAWQLL